MGLIQSIALNKGFSVGQERFIVLSIEDKRFDDASGRNYHPFTLQHEATGTIFPINAQERTTVFPEVTVRAALDPHGIVALCQIVAPRSMRIWRDER